MSMVAIKPKRIQRRRTKGLRMPKGAVYVGRPTKWANPFRVLHVGNKFIVTDGFIEFERRTIDDAHRTAVSLYRAYLDNDGTQPGQICDAGGAFLKQLAKEELRGKDLACWCAPHLACHCDVLLEVAND